MRLGKDIWVPFKRYQNTSGRGADVETSPLTFCRDGQVTANLILYNNTFPANIYLFKVNNKNTSKRCRICSNSTRMSPAMVSVNQQTHQNVVNEMFAELLKLKHKQLQAILFDITIVLIILFVVL